MTDATILIPTYRHAALLPYALRSALDQDGASVEVFVVGDGVEDDTREALRPFLADRRIRFFDLPKGARHGELHRHEALREAVGWIVCYLSDDDLLLPGHVTEMAHLLEYADFAHAPPAWLEPDGALSYFPFNYGRPEFVEMARERHATIGLTGTAHTLEAYRRLPYGWRTTPDGMPTDHYMWLQWLELPGLRAVLGDRMTFLSFPDPAWRQLPIEEREASLAEWLRRSRETEFEDQARELLRDAVRRAAEDYHLWARREQHANAALRSTRAWRLRELLVSGGRAARWRRGPRRP